MEFTYLNNHEKYLLALFFKRLCFHHVLDCTDGNNDKEQAYEMFDVIAKVEKELSNQGFNLR